MCGSGSPITRHSNSALAPGLAYASFMCSSITGPFPPEIIHANVRCITYVYRFDGHCGSKWVSSFLTAHQHNIVYDALRHSWLSQHAKGPLVLKFFYSRNWSHIHISHVYFIYFLPFMMNKDYHIATYLVDIFLVGATVVKKAPCSFLLPFSVLF